jgi:C1A family cysteine protease
LIKSHIKTEGAVVATFYTDLGIAQDGTIISEGGYYNNETNAFYCNNDSIDMNHLVTIVGWDDNFDKSNFPAEH